MEQRFKRLIESEFPYPIASEFRRLNTMEYLEQNDKRLKQLLKTSETTIHFLALIALVDLCDHRDKFTGGIPEWYTKEFPGRFTRTSFGKWIALFRDTVRLFFNAGVPMFIEELQEYFLKNGKAESEAQKAFNALTTMRNKLAHPDANLTKADIKNFCSEAEEHFDIIMGRLEFITRYPIRHVDNITVKFHKWHEPVYDHTFAEVVGTSSEFNAYKKTKSNLLNTPALIVIKQDEDDYLNLDPLIIFSDEGSNSIADVFLYMDWEPGKIIKYRPVWNGGEYNLIGSQNQEDAMASLSKYWEYFSDAETRKKCIKQSTPTTTNANDNEVVKFSFDD